MKLNNKGFAISSIMYLILVLVIILITITLSILGSRKLIIDKIKDEVLNNIYNDSILPFEYQQVEYIQSTGTEYIITDFIPNQDTRVVVDFEYITLKSSFLFGSRSSTTSKAYTVNIGNGISDAVTSFGNTGNVKYATPDTNRHIIDKNKNLFYLDGKLLLTQSVNTFTAPAPLEIFASYNGGTEGYLPSISRIYSFKIYDNDFLVRNFVPCYRISDGVVGLYDVINDVFYTNAGTGDFTKGNNIKN